MCVQEWLEQVKKLDQLITAKIAERDRLKDLATNISPKPMDGMPYSNTGIVSQRVQNIVVKLVTLEGDLNKLIDEYIDHKKSVVAILETLPEKEYGVLHRQYIRYMTQEQIAEDMGYCTSQIWRIRKKALKNLEDAIECNTITCYNGIVK